MNEKYALVRHDLNWTIGGEDTGPEIFDYAKDIAEAKRVLSRKASHYLSEAELNRAAMKNDDVTQGGLSHTIVKQMYNGAGLGPYRTMKLYAVRIQRTAEATSQERRKRETKLAPVPGARLGAKLSGVRLTDA